MKLSKLVPQTKLAKLVTVLLYDLFSVALSSLIALFLMLGADYSFPSPLDVLLWIAFGYCLTVLVFTAFRVYSIMYSYADIHDALRLFVSVAIICFAEAIYTKVHPEFSFLHAFIFTFFFLFFTMGLRFSKRLWRLRYDLFFHKSGEAVMIVGAGDAATVLIREMQSSQLVKDYPVCCIDDDRSKLGMRVCNVPVVGTTEDIEEMAKKYHVSKIYLAMPSVPNKVRAEILKRCQTVKCNVMTLPGIYQLLDETVSISKLRHVEIADLLGRDQVKVNLDEIMGYIENKTVLVTGGGGSIGSELCRQIATHNPKRLIILDIYENSAYDIEQELRRSLPNLNLITLIASIRDRNKLDKVFQTYRPEIVFNAAAHKHVPLMETSPCEAIKNNVFGTRNVAEMADKYGALRFVQISTDKAVNPTNIMGASKRICEMIIQTIGRHSKTKFVAVRFGNVLGSNGSVIPLFRKQLAEGGPITVTHKDIVRYFMTIPEAVSLVLQAGAYAEGGQIFVLDMGEQVRIYDLACNLCRLSGYEPNVDVEIKITGLRPGEKLYEERLMEEEGLQKTPNELISIGKPLDIDEDSLSRKLDELYAAAYDESDRMKDLVASLVTTYTVDRREA